MPVLYHKYAGFVLALVCVTGCSESTTPITADTLPGTYTLRDVQAHAQIYTLPMTAQAGPGTNYLALVSGSLTLKSDATFAISRRFENRRVDESVINGYDDKISGTYAVDEGRLTFTDTEGNVGEGGYGPRGIFIDFTEGIHRFTK